MDIITLDSNFFSNIREFRVCFNEKTSYKYIVINGFYKNIILKSGSELENRIRKMINSLDILSIYFKSNTITENKGRYDDFFLTNSIGMHNISVVEIESKVIFNIEKIVDHVIETYKL